MWIERFAVSPCSNPEMPLNDVLATYSELGFKKIEVFSDWAESALDIRKDPAHYVTQAGAYGLSFSSFHLPIVTLDGYDTALRTALQAVNFAQQLGSPILIFKADSLETYIRAAEAVLDRVEAAGLIAVIQNHFHEAIATLAEYQAVLDGIKDPRLKTLLEVGQFHSAGIHWEDTLDLLGDSVALIHIKDQIGSQSVPFGMGEIDLPGLFTKMSSRGYAGDYVIEMEVEDSENTLHYLAEARDYIRQHQPSREPKNDE